MDLRWSEADGHCRLENSTLEESTGGVINASFSWMKVVSLHFLETGVINKLFTPSRSPKHTRLSAPPEEEGLGGGWWKRRAGLETNLASIHY